MNPQKLKYKKMNITIQDKAKQINELHELATMTARKTLNTVLEAGDLLNEVKTDLPHGEFNKWCESNLNLSRTTIYRYMTLSENRGTITEAETPSEAIKLIKGKSSNMKHLKEGLYLKCIAGSIVTVYVSGGYIGYVNYVGSSYTNLRSIREDVYMQYAEEHGYPLPDKSYHYISGDYGSVPNEWHFLSGSRWLAKQLYLFRHDLNIPKKFMFFSDI